jgi:hypothetical protein
MLPEDPNWNCDDGNEPITHDRMNAIMLDVTMTKSPDTDMVWPAPVGTTLSWGGGKIIIYGFKSGIGAGLMGLVDDSIDYLNRTIVLLGGGAYNAGNKMPGEAAYSGAGSISFDFGFHALDPVFYTEDGATNGDPPGGGQNYLTLIAGDLYLFADSANGGALTLRNGGAATYYPYLVLLVSDQHPTRT